jgi:hypothetical protein
VRRCLFVAVLYGRVARAINGLDMAYIFYYVPADLVRIGGILPRLTLDVQVNLIFAVQLDWKGHCFIARVLVAPSNARSQMTSYEDIA